MIDIGIPEITVTVKYEDTDGRSIESFVRRMSECYRRLKELGL